ncbi:type II toxin-antitoxin system HicB family antitoxin [Patescibacteria group bacterium]|nr:type II toxin-antitoxin system HicB family antitoxin [Patescibacteria group bacterium]
MNKSSVLSYSVIYEEAPEGGYVVHAPALPGCRTQGETIEEAEKNIREAIELYLESLKAHDEEIPLERKIFQSKVEVSYPFV